MLNGSLPSSAIPELVFSNLYNVSSYIPKFKFEALFPAGTELGTILALHSTAGRTSFESY